MPKMSEQVLNAFRELVWDYGVLFHETNCLVVANKSYMVAFSKENKQLEEIIKFVEAL